MKQVPKLISKTRLMRSYQCPKSFYLNIHNRKLEPAVSDEQQAIFDQGSMVGQEARRVFPDGTLVDNVAWDFVGSLKRTKELLAAQTKVIYEAAFEYKSCYARADIIRYNEFSGRWTIYEAKSGTKIKDEYLDDIALQAWIMAQSGLPIEQINLMHLNPECRFPDLKNLFVIEDVTEKVREKYRGITPHMNQMFDVIRADEVPDVDIGPHCFKPNACPFVNHCFQEKQIPKPSVFDLPKIAEHKWELYRQGVLELTDARLGELVELSDFQKQILQVHKSKQRFVNVSTLQESLAQWKFPLVFLDFETINPAIPRYQGCAPYKQVAFQFSALKLARLDQKPEVFHYLHTDKSDPRPNLIEALLRACGSEGSIVSYYCAFEASRIQEMAYQFPEHRTALEALIPRLVDPLPLIRDNVYDDQFAFSFSLKKVAPALLGAENSYEGMEVQNGLAAQRAFEKLISEKMPDSEFESLKKAMIEYCEKDTFMMLYLVRWMFQECGL